MTDQEPAPATGSAAPIEAVAERLNDPGVAAALVTILDNAELLSTLVLGLAGFVERGDMIMDAVAEGVNDFKAAGAAKPDGAPSLAEIGATAGALAQTGPVLDALLDSAMVRPETIALLSDVSEAATEGVATAKANDARVGGIRSLLGTLRDEDVQRGLGVLVEISRALGRRMA